MVNVQHSFPPMKPRNLFCKNQNLLKDICLIVNDLLLFFWNLLKRSIYLRNGLKFLVAGYSILPILRPLSLDMGR